MTEKHPCIIRHRSGISGRTRLASRHTRKAVALVILAAAIPWEASAAPDNGTFSLQVENDYFSPNNKDRHYSNGLRVDWLPTPGAVGDANALERLARDLPLVDTPDSIGRIGWSLGQSIFTPQDKTISAPQPHDRPYAGWLYAGLTLLKSTPPPAPGTSGLNELDTLELNLGVVGPDAFGKQVQRGFHNAVFGSEDPKGWANQLKNEPGLLLAYDHKWRELWQADFGYVGADLTPNAGVELGNVRTDASVGLTVRLGQDLPADYGPPRILPGLAGSDFFLSDADTSNHFGWYLFAGVTGRAVARDIFLDGNSFTTSAHVTKLPFVADFQAGLAMIVYGARITATEVVRTKEFEGQNSNDVFGSITASFNF